jgi:glucose uptake protein GlcU
MNLFFSSFSAAVGTANVSDVFLNIVSSPEQGIEQWDDATQSISMLGILFAVVSSFFNGSFPVAARLQKTPLDPILFNGFVCLGAFLSSLFVPLLFQTEWVFTAGGFVAGILFVFAVLFSFIAIPLVGLAIAQAVWSASAIIVSALWGILGPKQVAAPVKNAGLTALAIIMLVAGALIAVTAEQIAHALRPAEYPAATTRGTDDNVETHEIKTGVLRQEFDGEGAPGAPPPHPSAPGVEARAASRVLGLVSAATVGLFGGSILVPFKFVPKDKAGLANILSFGIGAVLCGFVVSSAYWFLIKCERKFPPLTCVSMLSGILSGILWNIGNVCNTIAQNDPYDLPYGISYPILQCALVFGGLWGIYIFREITGLAVWIFWLGAFILAFGVVLLALFGPGPS